MDSFRVLLIVILPPTQSGEESLFYMKPVVVIIGAGVSGGGTAFGSEPALAHDRSGVRQRRRPECHAPLSQLLEETTAEPLTNSQVMEEGGLESQSRSTPNLK